MTNPLLMQKLEFLEAQAYRVSHGEGSLICLCQMEVILDEIDQVRAELPRREYVNIYKDSTGNEQRLG